MVFLSGVGFLSALLLVASPIHLCSATREEGDAAEDDAILTAVAAHGDRPVLGGVGQIMGQPFLSDVGHMMDKTLLHWDAVYGECDSKCGSGSQALQSKSCKHSMKGPQPDSVCQGLVIRLPPATRECTDLSACRWQCTPREDGCGWPEVSSTVCVNADQPKMKPPSSACVKAQHLKSAAEFTRDECRQTTCAGELPSTARVVTVNHLDKCLSSTGRSGMLPLVQEMYTGEDMVIVATQELVGDDFSKMVSQNVLSKLGLVKVASCSNEVSASIALYVKSSVRHFYAPISNDCVERFGQSSWTNKKGTMVMGVQTVFKPLVLASTHGARAGTFSKERVDEFEDASSTIMSLASAMQSHDGQAAAVFWGGDFNPRTYVTEESVLYSGTTHPTRRGVKDKYSRYEFDPSKAFKDLQEVRQSKDILGGSKEGPWRTVDGLLLNTLSEVPGLHKLCPSYYKTADPGSEYTPFSVWSKAETEWVPNWACTAPGSTKKEYYDRTKWQGTKDKARTPSWPDRIFTNAECNDYQKVVQTADHDVMHTHCKLPTSP